MSDDVKRQLTVFINAATRWLFGSAVALALFIFNDMRSSVQEIKSNVQGISDVVIRLEEKVERSQKDIDRLEQTKANKKN